ncbi:hypothetical protein SAMN04488515_1857 [Cognatiyoonia koreensis]|uniref:Dihydroorotate dehydrogenase n=1 Tax=Cognatiyoonia koreensis TaxID=364200 RepID=A0A1I0QEL6_9RHOB|nr:hypothetical protein [Cognatiyoonia koreensis]SEW25401.1 hypothetical protein SAMN04488515_1857 [Cognatiyoonia koreensis]
MTHKKDDFLEDIFATARIDDPVPSADLRARVLANAVVARTPERRSTGQLWPGFLALLGGWPALGGVAAAGVAGLWVGLAPPAAVESLAADVFGTTTSVSFLSGFDAFETGDLIDG